MKIWNILQEPAGRVAGGDPMPVAVCISGEIADHIVKHLPGSRAFTTNVEPVTYDLVFGMGQYTDVTHEFAGRLEPGLIVCRRVLRVV